MTANHGNRIAQKIGVSRETMNCLQSYVAHVKKWNDHINLVSQSSVNNIWTRHIMDSAQIFEIMEVDMGRWVDMGSGGGFPGIVVAILAKEKAPNLDITLIESDHRKAAFLQTVASRLSLNVRVLSQRIENVSPLKADVISARALAPLKVLLGYAFLHRNENGIALFHKGKSFRSELDGALENWKFCAEEYQSATENGSVILKIGDIQRA